MIFVLRLRVFGGRVFDGVLLLFIEVFLEVVEVIGVFILFVGR